MEWRCKTLTKIHLIKEIQFRAIFTSVSMFYSRSNTKQGLWNGGNAENKAGEILWQNLLDFKINLKGETILIEDPVLLLDIRQPSEEKVESLINDFEKLSPSDKSRVENLYDSNPEADSILKVVRIFKSNSIQGTINY